VSESAHPAPTPEDSPGYSSRNLSGNSAEDSPSNPAPDQTTDSNSDSLSLNAEDGAERRQFVIKNHINTRLDVYLGGRLKGISRSRIQKLIILGGVTINNGAIKASTRVRRGDTIDVILPPQGMRTIEPQPIPLDIVHEDEAMIIVNKQANLIVHPARSHLDGTLLNALAYRFQQNAESQGGEFEGWKTRGFAPKGKRTVNVNGLSGVGAENCRPGIVHRLDKNTTGVMVVAKSDEAHWALARQFEARTTVKAYLALVHGQPDPADGPGGVIDEPLGKHPTIREAYAVRHDRTAKQSVTLYRVRERYQGYTLLEMELKTGRTHQIRIHLQYAGMPIVGDITYGGEPLGEPELDQPVAAAGARRYITFARTKEEGLAIKKAADERDDMLLAHPALHAAYLELTHPHSKQRVQFTAAVHEPMAGIIRQLRKRPAKGPVAKNGTWVDLSQAIGD
jgi:23S rRNA pseudouridine1911/1915/1917 synthase